jgi:TonB family protein
VPIGPTPTPRYPGELQTQRLEGEVVVRFRVDERGRVDASSMQVQQSPHPLFTEAVRNVLPRFRFEPARSGAPGSKPQAAWVQFRTQFTARQ